MLTCFTADETAALFARKLRRQEQFFFLRYGDGALECIHGLGRGRTCDGEAYSVELGRALVDAWNDITNGPNVYVGDWLSASFDGDLSTAYEQQYLELVGIRPIRFVHFEGLLMMRESESLLEFYRAVREDSRRKLYVGPAECAAGADLLKADFFEVPLHDLFAHVEDIGKRLVKAEFDVLVWGAGMAGSIPVADAFFEHRDRTFINIGSGLDPLYRGKTRSQQISKERALAFMAEFL